MKDIAGSGAPEAGSPRNAPPTAGTTLRKRSISIHGHRTSVSLEDAFWQNLQRIADERGIALARLIATIDDKRQPACNLSSALRLHVLAWALEKKSG